MLRLLVSLFVFCIWFITIDEMIDLLMFLEQKKLSERMFLMDSMSVYTYNNEYCWKDYKQTE